MSSEKFLLFSRPYLIVGHTIHQWLAIVCYNFCLTISFTCWTTYTCWRLSFIVRLTYWFVCMLHMVRFHLCNGLYYKSDFMSVCVRYSGNAGEKFLCLINFGRLCDWFKNPVHQLWLPTYRRWEKHIIDLTDSCLPFEVWGIIKLSL